MRAGDVSHTAIAAPRSILRANTLRSDGVTFRNACLRPVSEGADQRNGR